MKFIALALVVFLSACGGGGGETPATPAPHVIASVSSSAVVDSGDLNNDAAQYDLLTVPITTSPFVPITLEATVDATISPGYEAAAEFIVDGVILIDGFSQDIAQGQARIRWTHVPAVGGVHTFTFRVLVVDRAALLGSVRLSGPSLTISSL